jgi:hypothetical protein
MMGKVRPEIGEKIVPCINGNGVRELKSCREGRKDRLCG